MKKRKKVLVFSTGKRDMTKHEFHIALVLIALIAAGVLGYDFLNTKKYSHSQTADCTLALYFSGPDGCQNRPAVRSISGPVFVEKIESYFSRDEFNLRDIHMDIEMPLTNNTHLKPGDINKRNKSLSPHDSLKAGDLN